MTNAVLFAQYNYWLVALSLAIATGASFATLDLIAQIMNAQGRPRLYWLGSGATVMGAGIWSMHYIGMLAVSLPIPVFYDVPTVIFSACCAVLASAVALLMVSRSEVTTAHLLTAGVILGLGVAGMHYSGMGAMRLSAHCSYNPGIVALSVLIAILVSAGALWIAFRLREQARRPLSIRLAASLVMGLAIASMHYTGMAAMTFHRAAEMASTRHSVAVSQVGVVGVLLVTFCILSLAIVSAQLDRNFSAQKGQLLEEKNRWDMLMRQEGVFDVNLLTGSAFHSLHWLEIVGYLPGELPATMEAWSKLIHPDDSERVQTEMRNYLEHRIDKLELEHRLLHRNGTWRWIQTRGQAVWDKAGRPTRILGTTVDITSRKEAEADLQASEAQMNAFMRNTPAIKFIKDADGRLVYTNPTFEKQWNLKPGEWLGKLDNEIWPAELAARIRAVDLGVLASDLPLEVTDSAPVPDGTERQFLSTKFSFNDPLGRRLLGGIALDITERVAAEQLVRDSEARYRDLFEQNPLPAWIYTMHDLRILEVNAAAIATYGWTREEFLGLRSYSIGMEGEAEAVEADLKTCAPLRKLSGPWRHRRKAGTHIWVELVSHEVLRSEGPARLIMVHDVTSRIKAEAEVKLAYDKLEGLVQERTAELRASETRWKGLVDATPQFIWSATPEGFIDYVNQRALDYAGMTLSQMLGAGWLGTMHPEDRERTRAVWAVSMEQDQDFQIEYRFRSKEGEYRWFKGRGVPIRDSHGHTTQWLGTCTDIDDNKQSQERLETAVTQRTAELAEARDRAEQAARSKAQFLAAMSHEIRTPMNGIIGMTALAFDTPLNSEQRCYLEAIRSSGDALLGIINDVLDFSKMEAGKLALEQTDFDLQTIVEEATDLAGLAARSKNVALAFTIDPSTSLDLLGDAGRLRQILLNLLSNAVKFTERGSVTLSVTQEALHGDMHAIRFAVKDTGIGITAAQLKGLFRAFTQADASTTRRFGGTGLGLSIAKKLVELMGGTMGVNSQAGVGSTFWFNICLMAGVNVKELSGLHGKHLAVAGTLSESKRQYLKLSGLAVTECAEGFEGLAQLASTLGEANFPLDVLLVDSSDVSDSTKLDRRTLPPFLKTVPILVLGSPRDWNEAGEFDALESVLFVPKPVRRPALLLAIDAAIRGLPAPSVTSADLSAKLNRSAIRVLVAEDNKINQMIARLLLEKLGCRVDMAANGSEACAAVEKNEYDVVFMDCQMPVMDGYEATRRIRLLQTGRSRTPIVALTAAVLEDERQDCYAAGMDDFLSKPISSAGLERALLSWVPALRG